MTFNKDNIKAIDKSDMKLSIESFPDQINEMIIKYDSYVLKNEYKDIKNVVILGMGGSAIGAEICMSIIKNEYTIPIFVNRNYNIPNWISANTLVIASPILEIQKRQLQVMSKLAKKLIMSLLYQLEEL